MVSRLAELDAARDRFLALAAEHDRLAERIAALGEQGKLYQPDSTALTDEGRRLTWHSIMIRAQMLAIIRRVTL